MVDLYGNDLGNRMVDVDDAIVKPCVEPKARVPRSGTLSSLPYRSTIWFSRSTMGPTAPVLLSFLLKFVPYVTE